MRGRRRYHEIGRPDLVVGGSLGLVACRSSQSPQSARALEPSWGVMSGDVTSSQAVIGSAAFKDLDPFWELVAGPHGRHRRQDARAHGDPR